ncbi:MAG: glycosyltransferase [Firmicutes bacterium]|nr:glycosyltransferase [Bacillota bacterium]
MNMEERPPTVSVIIPTYNRAHLIGRAIRSVLEQTYQDFEIIVVDDGSSDNTEEVVKSFNDPRIRYIRHEQNRGGSAARNTGIRAARGEYIAFLDSDDEWLPEKLERQVQTLINLDEATGLIYTGLRFVGHNGAIIREQQPRFKGYLLENLLRRNVIGTTSSVMVRRSCIQRVGLFDEVLPSRQDLDLWVRIAKEFKIDCVPEVLTVHYVHEQRITANLEAKIKGHVLFLAKYEHELAGHPKAFSWQLYRLGGLYLQKGDVKLARKFLWSSLRKWPYPRVVISWVLLLVSRHIYNAVKRIKVFIVGK